MAAALGVLVASFAVGGSLASASGTGPSGANIGFDFSWNDSANPAGHAASFLEADGTTANNCSGPTLTETTKTCNFVYDYRINGVLQKSTSHSGNWIKWNNPTTYADGKPLVGYGCSSPTSGTSMLGKAPLTLFDCFNANAFGQIFRAGTSGTLTQFRVSMTCLAPSAKYELYALLYELSADGGVIAGASPLGTNLVNLSKCPTATSWQGKTFNAKNFARIPMTFGGAQVAAGKYYGVYFTGAGVPGTPPPGAAAAMAAAKAASTTTTTTTSTTTTTTTPWNSFRGQKNKTAGGSAGVDTSTSSKTTPGISAVTSVTMASTQTSKSALRLLSSAQVASHVLNSVTPKVCVGSGSNLVFVGTGRCIVQIALRRNGVISKTLATRVTSGEVESSDTVVPVADPVTVYFVGGTSRLKPTSKKRLDSLLANARASSSILVAGHSGNMGGESSNLVALSTKRAIVVRGYLRDRGVSKTIAIWSYGSTMPVTNSKSQKAQDKNRRAEVWLIP